MDDIEFDELNENSIKSLDSILNTINNKIDNEKIDSLVKDINELNEGDDSNE